MDATSCCFTEILGEINDKLSVAVKQVYAELCNGEAGDAELECAQYADAKLRNANNTGAELRYGNKSVSKLPDRYKANGWLNLRKSLILKNDGN